jgi:hypothetical protein
VENKKITRPSRHLQNVVFLTHRTGKIKEQYAKAQNYADFKNLLKI